MLVESYAAVRRGEQRHEILSSGSAPDTLLVAQIAYNHLQEKCLAGVLYNP